MPAKNKLKHIFEKNEIKTNINMTFKLWLSGNASAINYKIYPIFQSCHLLVHIKLV